MRGGAGGGAAAAALPRTGQPYREGRIRATWGWISVDRGSKATLPLTMPRRVRGVGRAPPPRGTAGARELITSGEIAEPLSKIFLDILDKNEGGFHFVS